MKKICVLVILFCIIFLSCDRQEKGYLSHTIDQKTRMQKIAFTKQAQDAIQMYKIQNNSLPSSLEDVLNLPELPQNWEWIYDNKTGKIEAKKNTP